MITTSKENQLISINASAHPLVDALLRDAATLRIGVVQLDNGATLIDAGIDHPGSLEAGRRIGEICMAGLGSVRLMSQPVFGDWPWQVEVVTHQPMLACLGSQYAGWGLSFKEEGYHALGSGPARSLAQKEPLFAEIGYRDQATRTCLVLETDRHPPLALAEKVCNDCGVDAAGLTLILTPTGSAAGVVQIAARVVEVALHKAHALDFPVNIVSDGLGCTPLPPPVKDSLTAMGRTNDTILFGGQVHLFVSGPDDQAEALANGLPSSNSRDYGKPFAQVFSDYQYDFFKVDPMLFSPARVAVTATESGRTFYAGKLDNELLMRSFSQ